MAVLDETANNNDGIDNGTLYQRSGRIGYALGFDGNDYVTVGDDPSLDLTTAYSVFAWMYPTADETMGIVSKGDAEGAHNTFAYRMITSINTLKFGALISDNGVLDGNHSKYYITPSDSYNLNEWSHVGFTFNAGTLKLYINGAEITGLTKIYDAAIVTTYNSARDLIIGGYEYNGGVWALDCFNGKLDEVMIWGSVLTPAEIATYNDWNYIY